MFVFDTSLPSSEAVLAIGAQAVSFWDRAVSKGHSSPNWPFEINATTNFTVSVDIGLGQNTRKVFAQRGRIKFAAMFQIWCLDEEIEQTKH